MSNKEDKNTFLKPIFEIIKNNDFEALVQKARKANKIFHYIVIFAVLIFIMINVVMKALSQG